ncbi:putative hydrolase [Powai lake megavirus]|uniref:Putative hydrolase n=1 Tax=Powai lake megavirus TaxID=1842663 RepID=A0A167RQ19_9VIRU|nr:putative hydrolase [Powai lake megavirus]ANB50988.1 putative hydrolase [Powai lake megavirus]
MNDDIWLDYLSIDNSESNLGSNLGSDLCDNDAVKQYYGIDTESDIYLQRAIETWKIVYENNNKYFNTFGGQTFQINIKDRYYVIHVPNNCLESDKKFPTLIFLHGLSQSAWNSALKRTGLIDLANKNKFIVIFGQGKGEICCPFRNKDGGISFGDLYWEIEEPELDIEYLKSIMNLEGTIPFDNLQHNINLNKIRNIMSDKIYLCGYSNGGMYSFNMCFSGLKLSGICSMMGGYGGLAAYSGHKIDKFINKYNATANNIPIIIVTGTLDEYNPASQKAVEILREKNFTSVKFFNIDNRKHSYPNDYESIVWKLFNN